MAKRISTSYLVVLALLTLVVLHGTYSHIGRWVRHEAAHLPLPRHILPAHLLTPPPLQKLTGHKANASDLFTSGLAAAAAENASGRVYAPASNGTRGEAVAPAADTFTDLSAADVRKAVQKPVEVVMMTGAFFTGYAREVPDCSLMGLNITCTYFESPNGNESSADVLWYHAPSACSTGRFSVPRHHPLQLSVVMSMESAAYYACLDDVNYMDSFDVEMTYRRCSQVITHYFVDDYRVLDNLFGPPVGKTRPVPFQEKETAVVYINSNCGALSHRSDIMRSVLRVPSKVPVHSLGRCDTNKPFPEGLSKREVFRKYKFCVCMENSISKDYVTEKIWDGLMTGCVPVYLGPPNTLEFLPSLDAVVDYAAIGGTPEALVAELERLAFNETAYAEKLAWKFRPLAELSPGFLDLIQHSELVLPHTQCQLCQLVVRHRIKPQKYTHCLRNDSWMGSAATTTSVANVAM